MLIGGLVIAGLLLMEAKRWVDGYLVGRDCQSSLEGYLKRFVPESDPSVTKCDGTLRLGATHCFVKILDQGQYSTIYWEYQCKKGRLVGGSEKLTYEEMLSSTDDDGKKLGEFWLRELISRKISEGMAK